MKYYGKATYKSIPTRTLSENIPEIEVVAPLVFDVESVQDLDSFLSLVVDKITCRNQTLYLENIHIEGVRDDKSNRNYR